MWDHYKHSVEKVRPTIASELYHYCPISSLKYLLEQGADISCHYLTCMTKDHAELLFGIDLFWNFLMRQGGVYSCVAERLRGVEKTVLGTDRSRTGNSLVPASFSLTERRESAYHWNEYCRGGGCAIAFSQSKLDAAIDHVVQNGTSLRLIPCFYANTHVHEIELLMSAVLADVEVPLKKFVDSRYTNTAALTSLLCEVFTLAEGIKRERFRKDDEWRLVLVKQQSTCAAVEYVKTGIVDYCDNRDLLNLMTGLRVRQDANRAQVNRELDGFSIPRRVNNFIRFKSL